MFKCILYKVNFFHVLRGKLRWDSSAWDRLQSGQKLKCFDSSHKFLSAEHASRTGSTFRSTHQEPDFLPTEMCCLYWRFLLLVFFFLLTSLGVDLNQTNSYFSNVVAVFLEEHWIPASLVLSIPSQVCVCAPQVWIFLWPVPPVLPHCIKVLL